MTTIPQPLRSFVSRNSRMTPGQKKAYAGLGEFQLALSDLPHFLSHYPKPYLEIGFGKGHSLIELARLFPEKHFIGVETHKPSIGALLLGLQKFNLNNIHIFAGDAYQLVKALPPASLQGMQIFFPDPWPKRKHHNRRLIQTPFVSLAASSLSVGGYLHLATDWQNYAAHMLTTLNEERRLVNVSSDNSFTSRSPYRPLITNFEQTAIKAGRPIWELQFVKVSCTIDVSIVS